MKRLLVILMLSAAVFGACATAAAFDEDIKVVINYAVAYYYQGKANQDKGDLDAAIADYEAALRIDPDYNLARSNLEDALQARGR